MAGTAKENKHALKYVYRREHGYLVNINNHYIQFFGFYRYGPGAMGIAIKHRDLWLRRNKLLHALKKHLRKDTPARSHAGNKSGVIGVSRFGYTTANGEYYESWRGGGISFSINKNGNKNAFLMACKMRLKHKGELRVVDKKKLPVSYQTLQKYYPKVKYDKKQR